MTPKLAIAIAIALALLSVAVGAGPAQASPSAAARMTACATAPQRHLVAQGTMRAQLGASRMQMRFDLQSRTPDRPAWRALDAQGLGIWNSADAGVRRYVYEKRIEALTAPADYRMVVQFRWLAGGRPVARQRRVTRICRQSDPRPDLVPVELVSKGAGKGGRRYVVQVVNSGGSAAGPFGVAVTVGGAPLPVAEVAGLAAGARTRVVVAGPRCAPGSALTVRVDPGGAVQEGDEGHNELVEPCPGRGGRAF